ncbi:MAG TPA: hypothetical protein HA348_06750 [Thermoplasmata archaeon]|nr:hypothetical protein [Thermoplasmata archaeon]
MDACLTFFNFPQGEWISFRTTKILEPLNKEFKRRTTPMEIVAGGRYLHLTFICLKMELRWRSNPIGRVRNKLPFFKESAFNNFTQLT